MTGNEPLRRVGRGGAGNFYSKSDIEAAAAQHEDLEAAKAPAGVTSNFVEPASKDEAPYVHTGRGGAGNLLDRKELAAEEGGSGGLLERTKEAVRGTKTRVMEKIHGPGTARVYGRGGAGNWRASGEEDEKRREDAAEEERKTRELVEAKVRGQVDAGLSKPPRAYDLGRGKDTADGMV